MSRNVVSVPNTLWLALLCAVSWLASPFAALGSATEATAPQVETVDVALTIHRGGERLPDGRRVARSEAWIEGVATYHLSRPARAGEDLHLLNFAEAMHREPTELDEVALATYLDGPFRRGWLAVEGAWGATRIDRVGERRDVLLALQEGAKRVELRYLVKVPRRYWPFGCVRRRCSLSGAVAPLPSAPARGGRWLPEGGRVVEAARWNVERVRFATVPDWVPGTTPTGPQRAALRGDEIVVVGRRRSLDRRTEYPSVFWGPRWHRVREIHHGVRIEVLHMHRRPGDRVPRERRGQLYRDVPGRILDVSREIVDLLDLMGQAVPPDERIVVIQGPLRSRVAEFHPDTVLVSDQMLEIFPARRFVRFHEVVVARAVLDMVVHRSHVGRHDPSTDLWLSGAVSFALLKLWERKQAHPDEFAHDILRNVTFVPAVDRFLYTAQASFADAYFRGSEDHMPLRNHPLWFGHRLPTGRRIHEKLKDTLETRKLARFYEMMVRDPSRDPRRAAELAYGFDLDWFFDQWLGEHPSVDYAIKSVEGEKHGDRWRYRITIEQVGERPVLQPVQVLVTERGGKRHYLVWNGELDAPAEDLSRMPRRGTHTWEVEIESKIRTVQLDPRHRLVETPQPPAENVDPLFNNRQPKAARFLYTGAGLSIAASEFVAAETNAARFNAIAGFVSFEGSLRRDLRRTGHLLLMHNREAVVGAEGGAVLWLGPKVNRRRRRIRVPMFASIAWLTDSSLGSLDEEGGVRVGESVAVADDTRRFSWWPERGHRLSLSAGARQTLRAGTTGSGTADDRYDIVAGASWIQLWRLAHDHVLASQLSIGMVFPLADTDPEFRSLLRGGGIGALSGYSADEIFGLAQALAQLEYRHVYLNDLRVNLVHLAWLRSLGGTLFAGAATVSSCEGYGGWFGKDSFYGHVGYGLVAYLQVLGVTPQLFRVDLAVPLVRRDPVECLEVELPQHLADIQDIDDPEGLLPPFNINVTFTQPF